MGTRWRKITRGGVLFAFALLLVAGAAAVSANNLLFLILAAMLATFLVSGLISRLSLAALELELLLPEHISAKRKIPGRLKLRNLKRWMPSFSIQAAGAPILSEPIYFPVVPGGGSAEISAEFIFPKRGAHSENLFVFSTRFPFGFLEKTTTVTLRRETIVYPSLEPRPELEELLGGILGEVEMHLRGLGRDFYRIRPYEAFESARNVDWKKTAHTGELQVREFAREQQRTVEIFLDRNLPPDMHAWFESAIECCAFLVWRLSERNVRLHFHSQEYERRVPEEGDAYTILEFLALADPRNSRVPDLSSDESSFQIVFSAAPKRIAIPNWHPVCLLGPDAFSQPGAADAAAKD